MFCCCFGAGCGLKTYLAGNFSTIGIVILLLLAIYFNFARGKVEKYLAVGGVGLFAGIGYSLYLGEKVAIQVAGFEYLVFKMGQMRDYTGSIIGRILPEPYSGFLCGLLLGSRDFGYELKSMFKTTGLMHIVAVSGYNITILINLIYRLFSSLGFRMRNYLTLLAILLFVLIAGGSASVVRAGLMGGLVVFGKLLGRKAYSINALVFTGWLMVLVEPGLLGDIGFQLSFAATVGLIFFSTEVESWLDKLKFMRKWPKILKEALATTLAAQIFTVPIILYHFADVSLVSPISNTLVLPFIPLAMLVGFIGLIGGIIFLPLGIVLSLATVFVMKIIIKMVEILAGLPFASLEIKNNGWVIFVYLGIVCWIIYRKVGKRDAVAQ